MCQESRSNPIYLYSAGRSYLQAAQIVANDDRFQPDGHLTIAVYHLVGSSVELFLKAVLAHCGYSDKRLQELGHDLRRVYTAAMESGYTPLDDLTFQLVDKMRDHHKNHHFRYMPDGTFIVPNLIQAFPVLFRLDDEVREFLQLGRSA